MDLQKAFKPASPLIRRSGTASAMPEKSATKREPTPEPQAPRQPNNNRTSAQSGQAPQDVPDSGMPNQNPEEEIDLSKLTDEELEELYQAIQAQEEADAYYGPVREEVVLEWKAPSRVFKKRNKQYYVVATTIALLITLIFVFSRQFLPITVIISLLFMFYVINNIPPQIIENQITTYGIRIAGTLYYWEELGRFWIETKQGNEVLYLETERFPNRVALLLGDIPKNQVRAIVGRVLMEQKPPLKTYERAAKWLQEKFPLDASQD